MRIAATAYFLCSICVAGVVRADDPYVELGPMLGHVSAKEANIWIKTSAAAEVAIMLGATEDLADARKVGETSTTAEKDFMTTITAAPLAAKTRYFYAVSIAGKIVTPRPYPSFTTAPAAGKEARQRIAFSSCLGKEGSGPAACWAQLDVGAKADIVLLLGDNHYADSTARDKQSAAYLSHRAVAGFRSVTARIPTYGIWDDHDYGPNDSDGTAKGKEVSLDTFKDFWANPSYGEDDNPGIYCKFNRGGIDYFFLDGRYHRSPDKMVDDGSKTMLGAKQLAWLKRELKASTAKVKIIASGSELQMNGHTDSWTSYPRERAEFFKFIEDESITGVLVVSGDRHFSACYQIGGKLIEVTAGPMGSQNFPTKTLPDMFVLQNEGKIFCVLDIDTRPEEPKVLLEFHRAGDGLVKKVELPWKAVLGEEKLPTLKVEVESVPMEKKPPYQVPFKE